MPVDGYTDEAETEKKIVRDAFKKGDAYFNSGDLVRDQGWRHIAFVDRLGDTFRWKGENVATTEVEGAVDAFDGIAQSVAYGVEVPGTDGRAGMVAVKLREGTDLDTKALAQHLYEALPSYAVPLFVRVVDDFEQTSTFKNRKVELREEGYADADPETVYVLAGREKGYVEYYDDSPRTWRPSRSPRDDGLADPLRPAGRHRSGPDHGDREPDTRLVLRPRRQLRRRGGAAARAPGRRRGRRHHRRGRGQGGAG